MTLAGTAGSTSASLIQRVRERDSAAWKRLADLYTPLVYSWARRGGLRNSDSADTVQEVFRAVFQGIDGFQRAATDTSFRAWLWVITRNQVRLFYRKQGAGPQATGGSQAAFQLQQHADWLAKDGEPDAADNRRRIVHRALQLVQRDFSESTWEAFCRTTLQQHSVADVAADLGMTENAVRQAKFRVLRRLRQELDAEV